MRKNCLEKKVALLAVLGAVSPITGADSLLTDFGTVAIAEAATNSSVGEVSAFAKDSNPKGYLLCDGRAVSRTEYAELFAEIGTKYGAGDGSTTFNLPKLTDGRFIEGSSSAGTYHEAGLPNITGQFGSSVEEDGAYFEGAFSDAGQGPGAGTGHSNRRVDFDASKSNPIYGKSSTVQPNALTMRYYIKATKAADGGSGKIQAGDEGTISGDTAYKELRPTEGNYVRKSNTTADNLNALDSQTKANANAIAAEATNRANADAALENRAKADATAKANQAKTDAINDAAKRVSDAEARAKQDATNKANAAENKAKSYTDILTDATKTYAKTYTDEVAKTKANIGLNNINEAGKDVIRELAKNEIKKSGIDTTGDTIIINKPMDTKDIHVDGEITTTGGITAGGNIHGKGDLEIDGKAILHGDTEIDKNLTIHGNERVDGTLDVGGYSHIHGNQTVDGDSHIKGNETVDKDLTIHGNETVDGTLHVKDNAEFDKDVTVHGSETIDKNLHVKGDSVTHGNQTVDGDSHTKGNAEVDKDLRVHGNSITEGDTYTGGDSHVRGNESVDGDLNVSGNGSFGKDLYVEGTTNTGALVSRGDAVIGGNTHIVGDTVLDGKFFAKGAAQFGDNVDIAQNLTVGGSTAIAKNLSTGGDVKADGDIYGRSFNVGSERYIDKDGINANEHKIRNVADGEVSPNSLDAVNGSQLYNATTSLDHKLTGNINEVAANAAAMANLHPLEYNQNDKVSISAAVGGYKNQQALAVGVFYRPDRKTLISVSGSLGNNDNMIGLGVSKRLGQVSEIEGMTEEQLRDKVEELNESNKSLKDSNEALKDSNESLRSEVSEVKEQNRELSQKNSLLESSLSEVKNAYNSLSAKVGGLMDKIGLSNTAEK